MRGPNADLMLTQPTLGGRLSCIIAPERDTGHLREVMP